MPRDTRVDRDMHALDENGMVLCNPRDKEAAHRAEMDGIATHDSSAVTCRKCLDLMPGKFRRMRNLVPLAADFSAGDGVDPRDTKNQQARLGGRKPDHASQRLGCQIFDALCLSTLLSEIGLENFAFAQVTPTGRGGHFLVQLRCTDPAMLFNPNEVESLLQSKKGLFRAEVSQVVSRRRAPELLFRVLPPESD